MIEVFLTVILPVFFVFFLGFISQKFLQLDIRSISSVTIYIMIPLLVFRTFYEINLNSQYLYMVVFSLALFYAIVLILNIISKIFGYNAKDKNGLILASGFMNAGNYGAPVVLFALGKAGFAYSISFLVVQVIFLNSFGVYYSAKGTAGVKAALKSVLKTPAIYTFILAVIWKYFDVPLNESFYKVINLVADAAIPTIMLVLGMQLAQIRVKKLEWNKVSVGIIVRLIISPLIAWGITLLLPLDPLLEKVLIVSAAMPTSATTTMLSLQFNSKPELVSSITLLTTLLSAVTLSFILTII